MVYINLILVEVGFQGPDPSTDLRGAGILGLRNLHFYVLSCEESKYTYEVASNPDSWYFFCASGINFTGKVIEYIESGKADNILLHFKGDIIQLTHILYLLLFTNFNKYWVELRLNNFMQFNTQLEYFMKTKASYLITISNIQAMKRRLF